MRRCVYTRCTPVSLGRARFMHVPAYLMNDVSSPPPLLANTDRPVGVQIIFGGMREAEARAACRVRV